MDNEEKFKEWCADQGFSSEDIEEVLVYIRQVQVKKQAQNSTSTAIALGASVSTVVAPCINSVIVSLMNYIPENRRTPEMEAFISYYCYWLGDVELISAVVWLGYEWNDTKKFLQQNKVSDADISTIAKMLLQGKFKTQEDLYAHAGLERPKSNP